MRYVTLLLLGTLTTSPVLAEQPRTALEAAVNFVTTVVAGTRAAETDGLVLGDFVIADEPVACEQVYLAEWLEKWHSQPIVEELADSYRRNGVQPSRIHTDISPVPIVALHQFVKGDDQYDWSRLRSAHPEIRGVVRMSLPALDSQGVYAVAHYEVVTPKGKAFANFHKFEKQGDGTWKTTWGVTGRLLSAADRRAEAVARGEAIE